MAYDDNYSLGVGETTPDSVSFDYYSCEESIRLLNEYLDHELSPNERADVAKHLDICQPCLERFRFEQTLLISIKTRMQTIHAPIELKSRLSTLINQG